mmetsp:Transcript_11852/g.11384  ORF Transcript_11852/g.11384 Transcript_11852/m.11384 type:complete len:98 (+) Transcript_11852:590-883(+)
MGNPGNNKVLSKSRQAEHLPNCYPLATREEAFRFVKLGVLNNFQDELTHKLSIISKQPCSDDPTMLQPSIMAHSKASIENREIIVPQNPLAFDDNFQ